MPVVVDASVALAWAFGEVDPKATAMRERLRRDQALVPSLWWYEVRNALVQGERRGRLTERQTERFLRNLSRLPVEIDPAPQEIAVMALARRCRLTVYDAVYLELAAREAVPLATLDIALATAAQGEGVNLVR